MEGAGSLLPGRTLPGGVFAQCRPAVGCLSADHAVCLSVRLPFCLSVRPSVRQSSVCLCVCVSVSRPRLFTHSRAGATREQIWSGETEPAKKTASAASPLAPLPALICSRGSSAAADCFRRKPPAPKHLAPRSPWSSCKASWRHTAAHLRKDAGDRLPAVEGGHSPRYRGRALSLRVTIVRVTIV